MKISIGLRAVLFLQGLGLLHWLMFCGIGGIGVQTVPSTRSGDGPTVHGGDSGGPTVLSSDNVGAMVLSSGGGGAARLRGGESKLLPLSKWQSQIVDTTPLGGSATRPRGGESELLPFGEEQSEIVDTTPIGDGVTLRHGGESEISSQAQRNMLVQAPPGSLRRATTKAPVEHPCTASQSNNWNTTQPGENPKYSHEMTNVDVTDPSPSHWTWYSSSSWILTFVGSWFGAAWIYLVYRQTDRSKEDFYRHICILCCCCWDCFLDLRKYLWEDLARCFSFVSDKCKSCGTCVKTWCTSCLESLTNICTNCRKYVEKNARAVAHV